MPIWPSIPELASPPEWVATTHDVGEMVQLVVDELHETFAFYLAAIQQLDDDDRVPARRDAARRPRRHRLLRELLTDLA